VTVALDTGIKNARNVSRFVFGAGAVESINELLSRRRDKYGGHVILLVDEYFKDNYQSLDKIERHQQDQWIYVSTKYEPTTDAIDSICHQVKKAQGIKACGVVGIGGGSTLDTAKCVSNLLTNHGNASDYQGWDLVSMPGLYKIGVPTLSGTGSEATRTCVMTNKSTGLKLGMNSEYTVFDQLILDPDLTSTAPPNQYFFSGMDCWIHCVEALSGAYRNPVGDAFSRQALGLCREVFGSGEMMSGYNREKLMVASYLGGSAIAMSYVGLVHPFSAGLSVVLGMHHCIANCIVMASMKDFYPEPYREFMDFLKVNDINIPHGVCEDLSDDEFEALYRATIVHEKPLLNALGSRFSEVLNRGRVRQIFEAM